MSKRTKKEKAVVEQLWPNDGFSMEEVVEDRLGWASVYWIRGPGPRGHARNDVTDPPNAGDSLVFVLPAGGRRVRLFDPNTLQGYDVAEDSSEFIGLKVGRQSFRRDQGVALLLRSWKACEGYGFQRDFDTAARVLLALGAEVPMKVELEPWEGGSTIEQAPAKRGGKPAAASLTKLVPRGGRRGQVLSWFLTQSGPRSVREAMAEFDTTRSNVLTVLYQLHKEHGIGYELSDDSATLLLPIGGPVDVFEEEDGGF